MSNVIEASPQVKQMLLQKEPYTVILVDENRAAWVQHVEAENPNAAAHEALQQAWQEQTGDPSLPDAPEGMDYVVVAIFRGHQSQVFRQHFESQSEPVIEASPQVKQMLLQKHPWTVVYVDMSGQPGTESDNLVIHVMAESAEEAWDVAAARVANERYGGEEQSYIVAAIFKGHLKSESEGDLWPDPDRP